MDLIRIDVTDLKRFDRELRALGMADFDAGLRPVLFAFAATEATRVRARYREYYPTDSGAGVASILPFATGNRAGISIGGARAPYMIGQEFGSNRYRQFFPWTGPAPAGVGSFGRFLYPQLREDRDELIQGLADRLFDIVAVAFPDRVAA